MLCSPAACVDFASDLPFGEDIRPRNTIGCSEIRSPSGKSDKRLADAVLAATGATGTPYIVTVILYKLAFFGRFFSGLQARPDTKLHGVLPHLCH